MSTEESLDDVHPEYARCVECGVPYFPVHALTPCGHDAEISRAEFDEVGEVYSWTRTHGPDGPVLLAMADFSGGELRVAAPMVGVDHVSIADRVVVVSTKKFDFALKGVARATS